MCWEKNEKITTYNINMCAHVTFVDEGARCDGGNAVPSFRPNYFFLADGRLLHSQTTPYVVEILLVLYSIGQAYYRSCRGTGLPYLFLAQIFLADGGSCTLKQPNMSLETHSC